MKIAIIGGGAAGFFCAVNLKELSPKCDITIYEANTTVLAKVRISGGGRCNLTNSFALVDNLKNVYPRGANLIKRSFNQFNHIDCYNWFENRGVRLTTQSDECVFPLSQSSEEIISCLTTLAQKLGVRVALNSPITDIEKEDNHFRVTIKGENLAVYDYVIVTTGGNAKEQGYSFLRNVPVDIIKPIPSLFTLNIPNSPINELMGSVLPNTIIGVCGSKLRAMGALLITHWGVSGPAALKLSSYAAPLLYERGYTAEIFINWIGIINEESVTTQLKSILEDNSKRLITTIRPFDLTNRVWLHILSRAAIEHSRRCAEIGSKGVNSIVRALTNDIYQVRGKAKHREEFVTCGGVSLQSVNISTLEAKECRGLYFAGEVLDIDAITGGFNLQAAWSSGYTVANSIANSMLY